MPFADQNPDQHGWKKGPAATIVPYAYSSQVNIQSFGGAVSFPGGVASGTEQLWTAMLDELVPTIVGGIKQGECFGYENRQNVNNPAAPSFHSYGLALDINSSDNPNGSKGGTGKYQIGPGAAAIAQKYGMEWGGAFTGTTDPMHIEIHLSPDEVAAYTTGGISTVPETSSTNSALDVLKSIAPVAIGIALIAGIIIFTLT
jgi:hypothetical protein